MLQIREVFQTSQKDLLKRLITSLRNEFGYKYMRATKKFVYAEGSIPVLLVAHLDTVHKNLPTQLYFDRKENVMWSPQGIGADDRAGVWGIITLLKQGFRPYILFTTDEEIGGHGATAATKAIKYVPVKYIIELDRKGFNDAVFYDCDNKEFTQYVERFGFLEEWGTFSDISILCPDWKVAGVNLSTGYYNAHSLTEYLDLNDLKRTVDRVAMMLSDVPEKAFEYIEYKYAYSGLGLRGYYNKGNVSYLSKGLQDTLSKHDMFICDLCGLAKVKEQESIESGFCKTCFEKFYGDEL